MKKKTILVTGGAGNIGSLLVEKIADDPSATIVVADDLSTGAVANVPTYLSNVHFVKCDVNRYAEIAPLFLDHQFDYVVHLAAVVGVERTIDRPLAVLRDIQGIQNLLQLSRSHRIKRFHFASSSEVYGEPVEFPQNEETTPLNSRLPYAIVKNLGESYCKAYLKEYGLSYTIYRFFNTYGPRQSQDFVIPRFIARALANENITIYGDGSQTRTFIHVDDTSEICRHAITADAFADDTVNIGGCTEYTILELARLIVELADSKSRIIHLPALPEGDMSRRLPDLTKMRRVQQGQPIPLEEGIRSLISLRANGGWHRERREKRVQRPMRHDPQPQVSHQVR